MIDAFVPSSEAITRHDLTPTAPSVADERTSGLCLRCNSRVKATKAGINI
jgi:hypothetical protein